MKRCNKCGNTKPLSEFCADASKRDGLRTQCKICRRLVDAVYCAANRDKAKERSSLWYAENLVKAKASRSKWYLANAEKIKAATVRWQAANPEKNRARIIKWKAANPEACRIYAHNRRARERQDGGTLSTGITEILFKLQRGKCACGCKQPLGDDYHLDHVIPIALGGSNTDDNIQLLRSICNQQKHAKHPVDFMQKRGFLI